MGRIAHWQEGREDQAFEKQTGATIRTEDGEVPRIQRAAIEIAGSVSARSLRTAVALLSKVHVEQPRHATALAARAAHCRVTSCRRHGCEPYMVISFAPLPFACVPAVPVARLHVLPATGAPASSRQGDAEAAADCCSYTQLKAWRRRCGRAPYGDGGVADDGCLGGASDRAHRGAGRGLLEAQVLSLYEEHGGNGGRRRRGAPRRWRRRAAVSRRSCYGPRSRRREEGRGSRR